MELCEGADNPELRRGTINALDMRIGSAVRIFSPALGTALLHWGSISAVGAVAAALCIALLVATAAGGKAARGERPAEQKPASGRAVST